MCIKQIWSVIPKFPNNSFISQAMAISYVFFYSITGSHLPDVASSGPSINLVEKTDSARQSMIFKTIVESGNIAIGPLEYCGHGHIIHLPSGQEQ